jgi:hypothetical protein
MLEYWNGGMLGKDFSNMLACRRPRLHTYGRGRPYADIETPHYSSIPLFHHSIIPLLLPRPGRRAYDKNTLPTHNFFYITILNLVCHVTKNGHREKCVSALVR